MRAGPPKEVYTRDEARRLLSLEERQLRRWEAQRLVPRLEEFAWPDLIALSSLKKLLATRVPVVRVRRAVEAIRAKLAGIDNPFRDLKIVAEGRAVAVLVDGQKMEPVSGQLLLDFDSRALADLLSFPGARKTAGESAKREAERWFEKGLELEQTGALPEEIIAAYQRALELDPRSAGALVNLGTVYYHLQKWIDAERCYKRAIEADAEYPLAYFNLGNLYEEIGRPKIAATQYLAALRISPQYADAHYNFALLAQAQGDFMTAVRHWKAYLKLDGSSSWAEIARTELEKLRQAVVRGGGGARSQGPEDRSRGA
jgi:tetratricopeptide (TPR) repeat protein